MQELICTPLLARFPQDHLPPTHSASLALSVSMCSYIQDLVRLHIGLIVVIRSCQMCLYAGTMQPYMGVLQEFVAVSRRTFGEDGLYPMGDPTRSVTHVVLTCAAPDSKPPVKLQILTSYCNAGMLHLRRNCPVNGRIKPAFAAMRENMRTGAESTKHALQQAFVRHTHERC